MPRRKSSDHSRQGPGRMEWSRLADERCPSCGGRLEWTEDRDTLICGDDGCTFTITAGRYEEILDSLEDQEEGLSAREADDIF